jgi:hypothetical protein
MSDTLEGIQQLVAGGDVRISAHGYDELANDGLSAREILSSIGSAILVEDYPTYPKGASIPVLQALGGGQPVHLVGGIPKGYDRPTVRVTAYRPDPQRWDQTFTRRIR